MTDQQPNLSALLQKAQQMQQDLMRAQAEAAEQVVEGHAGGGAVKVRVTGGLDFQSVSIDPSAVDPDDVPMLEDLVLAAIHDAMARVNELNQKAVGGLGGIAGLAGGLGLPGLQP